MKEPIELHSLLKKDVTRLEGLLLTTELSRIGACYVVQKPSALDTALEGGEVAFLIALRDFGVDIWFA